MKTALAIVGASVLVLGCAGALGIGHFVMIYGPDRMICEAKK